MTSDQEGTPPRDFGDARTVACHRVPPHPQGGFWYGGQDPPPARLVERLDEEEARIPEVYALQAGRERGEMVPQVEALRDKLASIAQGPEWTEKRSASSALRRALLRFPRHPGPCIDTLGELGEILGTDGALAGWLHGNDEAGSGLGDLWRPGRDSLLERVLREPAAAAAWMLDYLSPDHWNPIRILLHPVEGVAPVTRRLLAESAIAAYRLEDEAHFFEDVLEHLFLWEQSREVDLEVSPLSLRDTLILHELTEMAVTKKDGLGPVAAHVAATVVERMCGRAVELAEAANAYFAEQRAQAGLKPPRPPRRRATDAAEKIPVMIVDDSSVGRHVVKALLRRLGHRVIEAVEGAEALAKADQLNPHLIVLDLALPDVDGLAVLTRIRALPAHRDTPVIVLTADRQTESVVQARRLGVVDYLTKPVDTRNLAARIEKHVGAR